MDLENTNQNVGDQPKKTRKYNVATSLLEGNNPGTIGQHLKNLGIEPFIPKFEDFVAQTGLDKTVAREYYDKVVGPEYIKIKNEDYDPWSYNKQFYPESLTAKSRGLQTFNNKTSRAVPISQKDMLVGSELYSGAQNAYGKEHTIVDDIADNAGYAKLRDGRRIPVSMIQEYSDTKGTFFEAVKTNDSREYEWKEMEATSDPAGKIVRSVDGIRTALGQLEDDRSIWNHMRYSGFGQGIESAIAYTKISMGKYLDDRAELYDIPALRNSKVAERTKKELKESVEYLNSSANRNFNQAKSYNVAALDEQGLDTWRGAAYSLAATIPQQIPIIGTAWLTRGASFAGMSGAALESFAKIGAETAMASLSMMAAGTSMNQFMDWGMSRDEAFNYGTIMGLIEYATEKTIPANIMYSAGIRSYSDDIVRESNAYLMEAAKSAGLLSVKELPKETKKQALKYAFDKVRTKGLSDWLIRLSEKSALGKVGAIGIEEGLEEGLYGNLYTIPVEFIYEQSNKKLAEETENRYKGVQWIEDNDNYFRVERDGKIVQLDEGSWIAEQRDYSKSISLNSGQTPFSSGESWIKEGLLGAASAILTGAPMALTQHYVQKKNDNHIASIVSNITSGNISLDEAKQAIMSMQLSKNFIDNNGKPITSPRSKVDEDVLNEEKTKIIQTYQEQLNQPLTEEQRTELKEQQKKALDEWQVKYDSNQTTMSMDELAKMQLIEQVEMQLQLVEKYKSMNPQLLTAIGGNTDLLRETIGLYKKLEVLGKAESELDNDNAIKTEVPNFIVMNKQIISITKATTKEELANMRRIINKNLSNMATPESSDLKYSKRYQEIYNNHKIADLAIDERVEERALNNLRKKVKTADGKKRLETNEEVLRRINTNDKLATKYNDEKVKESNKIRTSKLSLEDIDAIISSSQKYGSPMNMFESITNMLFAKNETSFLGRALAELNAQLQAEDNQKQKRFGLLPGKINKAISDLNLSTSNIGQILDIRKKKGLLDSNLTPNTKEIRANLDEIYNILNEGFGEIEGIQESLSQLSEARNAYQKAIDDAAKLSEEIKAEVEKEDEFNIDMNESFFRNIFEDKEISSASTMNEDIQRIGFEPITMESLTPAHEEYLRENAIKLFFDQKIGGENGFVDFFKMLMREDNSSDVVVRKQQLESSFKDLKDLVTYGKLNRDIFQQKYTDEEKKEFSPLKKKPFANMSQKNKDYMNQRFSEAELVYSEAIEFLNNTGISKEILQSVSKVTDLEFTLNIYSFIKDKIAVLDKKYENVSSYVKIDAFVIKIEALLESYKKGMSFKEIINTINTSSSPEEVDKLMKLIDSIQVYNLEIKNAISDINKNGALDKIIEDITSEPDYMYYYDIYSYNKAFDEKGNGKYSKDSFNKDEFARRFQAVSFLYSFKDCGKKGTKSVHEIYKVIQAVQEARQNGKAGNMVSSYHQEMVLLQALINFDKGAVSPLDNPLLDKQYINRKDKSLDLNSDPLKRSFLVDGFPGSGKTTVFYQDYVSAISLMNQAKGKGKLKILVISPTNALLKTYREDNLPLIAEYVDDKAYSEITLDEFMNSTMDVSGFDLVVFDEFSAITQKTLFGLPETKNTISKKLNSFDGQALFLGDNGQVAYEQYHSIGGAEYKQLDYTSAIANSRYIAGYFTGERAIIPLQDSYRYGNVQNKYFVDFVRMLADPSSHDKKYGEAPIKPEWGYMPIENETQTRKDKNKKRKIGIRLSNTSDVIGTGKNENAVFEDFLSSYREFKEVGEDTSVNNLLFIVNDVVAKKSFEKKIDENDTLSKVEKEELKGLIKTAVRDEVEPSSFVSGLSSKNVFVFVDTNGLDYHADWNTAMFFSRLLMAPVSRVRTNGYMHVYVGDISPKTYVKAGQNSQDIESLSSYKESVTTPDELFKRRQDYIDRLTLFTERENEKDDDKGNPGPDIKPDVIDINNKERTFAISDEQQIILAELTKEAKDELIKNSSLEQTVTSENSVELSRLLNKMLFLFHTMRGKNTNGEPILTEKQFSILKSNIDSAAVLYNKALKKEGKTNELLNDIEFVRNAAYTGGDLDYANAVQKPTIIPYVTVKVNGKDKLIDMIDVVGMKEGKPIVDVYFISSTITDKDLKKKHNKEKANIAFTLAKEKGFIINQVKVISVGNNFSKIVIEDSKLLPENVILEAQTKTGTPIASVDDLYSSFLSTDKKTISPLRTESIITESRFYEPKIINGVSHKLIAINHTMVGDEKVKTYILQDKRGNLVSKNESEYTALPDARKDSYELFNENAIIFEKTGLHNSTSVAIPISIGGVAIPLHDYIKSKTRKMSISNPLVDLRLTLIGLIKPGTLAYKKYVETALVYNAMKEDYQNENHILYTFLDKSFFDSISPTEKTIVLSKIKKIVDEAKVKNYDENKFYDFLEANYLNVISNDFKPETNYGDTKLDDTAIKNQTSQINEVTVEIEKIFPFDGATTEDEYQKQNIILNANRLNNIVELKSKAGSVRPVVIGRKRMGALFSKKNFKSDTNDVDLIIEHLKNEFGLLFEFDSIKDNQRMKKSGKIFFEVILKPTNNDFENISIRMYAKKASSSYVDKLIKDLEGFKDIERLKKSSFVQFADEDASKAERFDLYKELENSESFQFILANQSNLLQDKKFTNGLSFLLLSGNTIHLKKNTPYNKYQQALEILKSMKNNIDTKDAYYNMAIIKNGGYQDLTTMDGPKGKRYVAVGMPQILSGNAIEEEPKTDTQQQTPTQKKDNSKQKKNREKFKPNANEFFDFNENDNKIILNFDRSASEVTAIIESIIGSKNMKKLKLDLQNNFFGDANTLGRLSVMANILSGKKYLLNLKNKDGFYDESVARHEAAHFVSLLLLSPKQRTALENEVRDILIKNEKDPSTRNIYEHIADSFMNKAEVKKMSLLSKFVAVLKQFVNKFIDIDFKLAEFNYVMERGGFQNKEIYEIDEEFSFDKKIDNIYTSEKAKDNLMKNLFSEANIQRFTQQIIPYIYKRSSNYSSLINVTEKPLTSTEIINLVKEKLNNRSNKVTQTEVSYVTTNDDGTKTTTSIPIESVDETTFVNLTPADKQNVIYYNLRNENVIESLMQQTFYDMDIESVLSGVGTASDIATDNFNENERSNPDNMISSIYKLMLSTIPLITNKSMREYPHKPYDDDSYQFVFYDYVDAVLKNAVLRLKDKNIEISRDSFFKEIKYMSEEYSESELKSAALSIWVEFGDYNGAFDKKTGEEDLIDETNYTDYARGIGYTINNSEKIAREISTKEVELDNGEVDYIVDEALLDRNEMILKDKVEKLNDLISRMIVSAKSVTETVVSFVDMTNPSNIVIKEFSGSDITTNYTKLTDAIKDNLYEENRLNDAAMKALVGESPKFKLLHGKIFTLDEKGNEIDNLDVNVLESGLKVPIEENAAMYATVTKEVLTFLGLTNVPETVVFNLISKKGYLFGELVYQMLLSTYISANVQKAYDNFLRTDKEVLRISNEKVLNDEKIVRDEDDEIDLLDPNNTELISNSSKFDTQLKTETLRFMQEYRNSLSTDMLNMMENNYKQRDKHKSIPQLLPSEGLQIDIHEINNPSPLDFTKKLREFAIHMTNFEYNSKAGKIKDPSGNSRYKYSRTTPLDELLYKGNMGQSERPLSKRVDDLMKEQIADYVPLKSIQANLFYSGELDYDLMYSAMGIETRYKGSSMDELSVKDFMTLWVDDLFGKDVKRLKSNATLPIFLDNFADKTRVPYASFFGRNFKSPMNIFVDKGKVSKMEFREDIIIKAISQTVDMYLERQERTIQEFKNIGINIDLENLDTKIPEDKIVEMVHSDRLSRDLDYIYKDEQFFIGPSVTFDQKESIFNNDFITKWKQIYKGLEVAIDENDINSTIEHLMDLFDEAMKPEMTAFGELLKKSNYMFSEKLFSKVDINVDDPYLPLIEEYLPMYNEKYKSDKKKKKFDAGYFSEEVSKEEKKIRWNERDAVREQMKADFPDFQKKLKDLWDKKNKKKSGFKELMDNAYIVKKEVTDSEGNVDIVDSIYPPLKALAIGFFIMNNQLQQLYKGDEYHYGSVTNFVKRAAGDVSPIDRFDTSAPLGLEKTVKFIHAEDIGGYNSFIGESVYDEEMETNGYSVHFPWHRIQMRKSGGGELFSSGDGVLKTTLKEFSLNTGKATYLKFSQDHINHQKYKNDGFLRHALHAVLKQAGDVKILKGIGENGKVYESVNLERAFNQLILQHGWEKGNKEFNKLLFRTGEDGKTINSQLPGFIVHSSGFKTGQRGLNFMSEITNENGVKENRLDTTNGLTYVEVSTRNYGLQIVKGKPTEAQSKPAATQNLRMSGLSNDIEGKDGLTNSSRVNSILSDYLVQFENALKEAKILDNKDTEFDANVTTFLKKLAKKFSNGKEASIKINTLLEDSGLSIDILKSKHIQNLLVHLNSFLNPSTSGNTYVQAPTQMIFSYNEYEGFYRYTEYTEGSKFNNRRLKPTTYGFLEKIETKNDKGEVTRVVTKFRPITKDQYDYIASKTKVPMEEMSDEDKIKIGISKSVIDETLPEDQKLSIQNENDKSDKTWNLISKAKLSDIVVRPADIIVEFPRKKHFGITDDMEIEDVVMSVNPNGEKSFSMYDKFYNDINFFERRAFVDGIVQGENKTKEALFSRFNKKLHSEFERRMVKLAIRNEKMSEYELAVEAITSYYQEFNKSLYVFADRIPHSGFNSGQLGRIVAFAKGVGNTIYISSEKSILDGSDYDIDELHCFFENISDEFISGGDKITNSLFSTIKDTYLSWENIPLFAMKIDLSALKQAAAEIASKNAYTANGINTRLLKMKQGYAGRNLVGHFVNIQNAVSVMYSAKKLMSEEKFEKFVSKDFKLLYDKSYVMQFLDLNQAFINAATDNSKLDGILGKLNITDGNTSMLAGMMLQLVEPGNTLVPAEQYNMLDFIKKYLGSEILQKANVIYENNNSVTTGGSKTEYRTAIESAFNELKKSFTIDKDLSAEQNEAAKEQYIEQLKKDKDFMLKSISMGEALKSFYDFDLLNKIKPNEHILNNTIFNFEKTLGMKVKDFLKGFDKIKETGVSVDIRNQYGIDNVEKYKSEHSKEVFGYIDVPGLIANNNLFLNYVKSLDLARNITSAFMVNKSGLKEEFLALQSKKQITFEDNFNTLNSEMEKVFIGAYLDNITDVKFTNVKGDSFKFNLSIPSHRALLINKTPEFMESLKTNYPDNLLIKRLGINNQYGDFPVMEIKDSKYYSPAWKNELASEFKRLDESDKQIIRLISLIVYGFSNTNGSISEFTDSIIERDFSTKKESILNSVKSKLKTHAKDIAITNWSLQNVAPQLDESLIKDEQGNPKMEVTKEYKDRYGSVVTPKQNNGKFENNVFYINDDNKLTPVQAIHPQRINTYSSNKVLNSEYPVLRKISHTRQRAIYDLKNGESMSFTKPSNLFYLEQKNPLKPSRMTKNTTVVLENGVIADMNGSEYSIVLTKKTTFNQDASINDLTPKKANMFDSRKHRIASRFAEHVVNKLKIMFPNVQMQVVTNDNALERNVSGYVYNGGLYINADMLTPDTPLHEIGHIVTEVLKHSNRALYEQLRSEALSEYNNNSVLRDWVNNKYSTLTKEDKLLEVISLMIGFNTEDRIDSFYKSIGSAVVSKKSFIQRANDAIRSFIKSVGYILFGNVSLGKIDNIENISISGLSDILIDAYMNDKKVSDVNSLVLRDMMMLNSSNIRRNVANITKLGDLISVLHESDNLTKQLGQLDEDTLVSTIYNEAISNSGVVRIGITYDLSGIDLKGKTREDAWKEYIRKYVIKDLSYTHDIYVENVLEWLNKKQGSLSDEDLAETFALNTEFEIDSSIYKKFLYAINFDKTKQYVRYSDLKGDKELGHLYDERLLGFNPIIAIEKINGRKIISIYDITPTTYDPDKINTGKQNILGAYIGNVEAHMYGVNNMKNTVAELRQLYVQLLVNHISKVSDVAVDNTSVIKFNRGEVLSYLLDNVSIKRTIEGIKNVKKFFDVLSPELQEVFSNPVKTVDVPYYEFLQSWYETHEIDSFQKGILAKMKSEAFDKNDMRDQILSRMRYLSAGNFGFLNNEKMNEIRLLANTYKELYGLKVNNAQLNPNSISRDLHRMAKGTMNIGDELFMFVRDVITNSSNEVVKKIIDVKDELHGNSKSVGIIKTLQDNYASIDGSYTAQSFLAHNEHKVYEKMYAYVNAKHKDGHYVKMMTNNILWSLNKEDYIKAGYNETLAQDFANQAAQNFSGNNVVLEQAEKITNFVEKMLINRVIHSTYMKSYKRLTYDEAKAKLYANSNYKKGMVPVMNKKSSEEFYRGLNWKASIESSAQEFVQEMTTFDYNFKQKRNELGIITEINDIFLEKQFGYSENSKPKDITEISSPLGLLTYTHNLLGIGKELIGGSEEYVVSDQEKNESLSMNLQTSLLYFALNGIRKEVHEEKSLPIINSAMVMVNEMAQYKDAQITGDGDSLKKLIEMYSDMVVFGKQTKNDKLTVTEKVYNTTNRIITPMAMLGNMGVPLVSAATNAANAFLNGLGSSFFETGEPTLADLTKASAIVMNPAMYGRVSEWAYRYQLINSSELESITHRWKGVVGEKYVLNQFLSNFPNWGTDFYARAVSMVAHMIMDGSWEAHKFDKETGKVYYDESLDARFMGDKGEVMRRFFKEQLESEGFVDGDVLQRGYFFKSAKAMKVYADRKIIGANTTEVKNILGMFFLGKMFTKFSSWMFTAIDNMFGKGQYVTDGGRVVVKQDPITGEYYAEWERMFIEGWVRSYFELAKEVYKYRDISAFNKLNNVQKANIVKGAAILAITTALALLTRLALTDDDRDKMKKETPFLALMYRTAVNSLNSTLLVTELYRKAENPFALIGMSIDNFDNLYKAFFNSKNEPEFNYNRLQKVVKVLNTTDYIGLTNDEE